jgi:hypothetical protein
MVCHDSDHAKDAVLKDNVISKENEMNLLDRYVSEVGKYLPRKQRADIEKEIRSTLEDMLEERNQASVKDDVSPQGEAAVVALLKEYGEPRKVAESYIGPRYLISPRLYPTFELIVKIVMAALLGASLLGYGMSAAITKSFAGTEFFSFLGQFWLGLLGGMMNAFGAIVIVFAIIERVMPASKFEKEIEEEWNPADLAKEPDPDEVKISETIGAIIVTVAGLVIFNLYPNVVGIFFNTDGKWTFIPALSDAFFTYLPWINLLSVLQIAFNLYQLRQKAWTLFTRLSNMVIKVGTVALAIAMLNGPSLLDLSAEKLAGTPLADAADVFSKVMNFAPSIALIVIIIVSIIEVAQMIYRLFTVRDQTR